MTFSYLSVCSGLEGASLAFEPLGATPVGFAEIEKFPAAIIAHRYGSNMPGEPLSHNAPPNFGDFTTIDVANLGRVDVLIGGTPCQAFSIAGNRLSLADARGNLTLSYAVLAHELARSNGLRNAVWENVPGALSTQDNAFGCFLGAIVGADDALHTPDGGSWPNAGMASGPRARAAWRVLDAQYFGVAQRRRRVFLVADFGNGADPAAVLFEPKGVRGNTPPRREQGQGIAPTIAARTGGGGGLGTDFDCDGGLIADEVASTLEASHGRRCGQPQFAENLIASTGDVSHCLNAGGMGRQDYETETLVAHALRAEGFDASEDGTGRGTPIVPVMRPLGASEEAQSPSELAPVSLCHRQASGEQFAHQREGVLQERTATDPRKEHAPLLQCRSGSNVEPFDNVLAVDPVASGVDDAALVAVGGIDAGSVAPLARKVLPFAGEHARLGKRLVDGEGGVAGRRCDENEHRVVSSDAPDNRAIGPICQEMICFDETQITSRANRSAPKAGDPCHPLAAGARSLTIGFSCKDHGADASDDIAPTLRAMGGNVPNGGGQLAVAFDLRGREGGAQFEGPHDTANIRAASGGSSRSYVATQWAVRRLTPKEAERLQGVPDDYTAIPWRGRPASECPDGPRYKALGNSWAVPVVRWIGARLAAALEEKGRS